MERKTRQREAIRLAFQGADRPLGTDEVLRAAQLDVPGLGIATVYRSIKSLVESGFLVPVELPGEPPRYEPAGKPPHHHFKCRSCHRVFDLMGAVNGLGDMVPVRFQLESHELVMHGRCADCSVKP